MEKFLIPIAIIVVIALIVVGMYNSLVKQRNLVEEAYSTMDVYMKKRYDLIPNLVETVKGYAKHEQETLDAVISARNKAVGTSGMEGKLAAEGELNNVMTKFFALAESYPDLKANTNFLDLQNQVKQIETEIAQSRKYYNATTRQFNTKCETFPSNLIAGMFGFKRFPLFEITQEAERQNVEIKF